jgi:hypothetical protein
MLTEADWLLAWKMFRNGMAFRDIERYFWVGHTTIACGFVRKGWYDRGLGLVLPGAPDYKTQQSTPRTTFVERSMKGWTGQQEFVAAFLAERKKPASFIAEVVNRPVHEVERFLSAA